MRCDDCFEEIEEIQNSIIIDKQVYLKCKSCGRVYSTPFCNIEYASTIYKTIKANYGELKVGDEVIITDKDSVLFLDKGIIDNKDHVHYRVKIISADPKWHDKLIWIPHSWVNIIQNFEVRTDNESGIDS